MIDNDTWGRDPQIRYMRGVFSAIEKAQKGFLETAGIAATDGRLRRFREIALKLFERAWVSAMQKGLGGDENSAAAIYIFCLAKVLSMRGIDVPRDSLPQDTRIKKLVDEAIS